MKSKLYTRTGDTGTTALSDGSRTPKDSMRVESYGEIDELTSALGLLAAGADIPDEQKGELTHLQRVMMEIGGYLATPVSEGSKPLLPHIEEELTRLEGWIDATDERIPVLKNFILPGGSESSCRCHLARTICRRAERKATTLAREEFVDPRVMAYLNRVSDYLFAMARYLNFLAGIGDVAWHPRS